MRKLLLAKTVVLPDQLLTPGAVLIEDNVILKVGNCLDDEVVDERIDFEDAIRNAISLVGDSDTLGAIVGGVTEAYYGIPMWIKESALEFLDKDIVKCLFEISGKLFNYFGCV